jgi:hypothetical protein
MVEFQNNGQLTKRQFAQGRLRIIEVGALPVLNGSNDLSASKFYIMVIRNCVVTSTVKPLLKAQFLEAIAPDQ